MFEIELATTDFQHVIELAPERLLFVPGGLSNGRKMVLLDLHEINLTTFGEVKATEIALGTHDLAGLALSVILDVYKAPNFDFSNNAYVFMRFNDSVKLLNLNT